VVTAARFESLLMNAKIICGRGRKLHALLYTSAWDSTEFQTAEICKGRISIGYFSFSRWQHLISLEEYP